MIHCAVCGQRCEDADDVCAKCGEGLWHLEIVRGFPLKTCPHCEGQTLDLQPFCVRCGFRLMALEEEAPPEAVDVRRAAAEAVAEYKKRGEKPKEERVAVPLGPKEARPPGRLARSLFRMVDRLRGPAQYQCRACQAVIHPDDLVCAGCGAALRAGGVPAIIARWPQFRPRLGRVLLLLFGTAALAIWTARVFSPTTMQKALRAVEERRLRPRLVTPPGRAATSERTPAPR